RHRAKMHFLHACFSGALTKNQQAAKRAMQRLFDKIPCAFHEIDAPSVPEAIDAFQENRHPIDLLVMIKHRQSFIERLLSSSVTHKISLNNRFPFLVLPSEAYETAETKEAENARE